MRNVPQTAIALALALLVLVLSATPISGVRANGLVLVPVVAASLPISAVSLETLRSAFQGEYTEWSPGKRLIPINHPPGSSFRERFDRVVLGLTPVEMGRFWIDRRIRDQGSPPKTVPTAELAMRLVISLPGAITYVTSDALSPKLKELAIEGKRAGDEGYVFE